MHITVLQKSRNFSAL